MTTPGFPFDWNDITKDVFSQNPEMAFLGRLSQQGGGPALQNFFRARQGDFLSRFRQHVSRQLLEMDPNHPDPNAFTPPEDFFGGINFRDEYLKSAPTQRGMFSSQFAPRAKWIFNR